jgi:hypothetical protein
VLYDKYKCLERSKSEKILTIFKLYFSQPFCKKGLGLPAENTHGDGRQRWRRTYRSSLLIVQWVDHTGLKNMAVCQDWDKQYFNLFWFIK